MARGLSYLACCLIALSGCVDLASLPPLPTKAEQCQAWGYAPGAPECDSIFHRDRQ